ncbi:phosphatase PAP2 family protein [Flavobacterium sp. F372]|uniref:Phosphatase PAP2 family protein n=1 Tax=Flavobacterium bernardetii TaxID=2813823 RepID=A0ABR7IZX3_9FLAO|nr:phosphatase PAP2 family protein [Flavobacterium bernardetii]MBC5835331.1 phosphatase PAP2 family protein [Flavobacterium bernardetii]NHF69676.1 phosphatase PAP2 family protein [Flavobacterium bernardetii]
MLEEVINLDKKLFIFLNNLGSEPFDGIWLLVTKQFNWIPFFLLLLVILYKKIGTKQLVIVLLTVAALITFTNEITDLIKFSVQRIRPCNDEELVGLIRIVKDSETFSYFSGHAANSMAAMMFVFLVLRSYYKYSYLIFLYPLIFAYSRIYLGLHFPLDIISGYIFGTLVGILFYRLYLKIISKYITS